MWEYKYTDELCHFGIPGMRWGRRKNRSDLRKRYDSSKKLKSKDKFKQVKKERKDKLSETYNDIQSKTSLGKKLLYGDAVRKKAARFVVDNDIPVGRATKMAEGRAWINTAILGGVVGAATIYGMYKNK